MPLIKNLLCAFILILLSQSAWAFMPTTGIWGVDSEDNGLPGRGFQIEAENEIIVFTYFGYRPDGSSVFYYASGPIVNNTFTAPLLDLHDGTTFGGEYQAAKLYEPAGTVTLNFTNGTKGFITLPDEPQRAISKRPFGYANNPEGLLGTWVFTSIVGLSALSEVRNLSVITGDSTPNGSGIVTNADQTFICEHQVSGSLAGYVLCSKYPFVANSTRYTLQISGDKGTGTSVFKISSTVLSDIASAHAIRVRTKTGKKTGLNEGALTGFGSP